ncbi:MAG: hypothetical protein U0841_09235 [Chloroflexia bacterium]
MSDIQAGRAQWGLDLGQMRDWVYRAPTPRERRRWHAPVAAGARLVGGQGGGGPRP